MFGIGPLELIVITVVAILFIGPEKLPDAMRKFGKFFVQIRRHANDVKGSFQEIIHDAERELELEKIRELQAKLQNVSPSHMLESSLQNAVPKIPELYNPGSEPFDYHESHYKDGVYTETGADHMHVADPILQPDPPAHAKAPASAGLDKAGHSSGGSAPNPGPASAAPSSSPSPSPATAAGAGGAPQPPAPAAEKSETPFEKKASPQT